MTQDIRLLQCLVLASGLVLGAAQADAAPAAGEGAAASAPAARDLHSRRGYLAVSPGVIAVASAVLSDASTASPRYIWGIEGGYHFPIGRSLMIQPGLVFEHSVFRQADATTPEGGTLQRKRGHLMRVGPQVRIGGGNAKVFGYALLSVTSGIIVIDLPRNDGLRCFALPMVSSTVGGGVQGLIMRRILLGGELNVDLMGALLTTRARLYAGIMF